MQIFHTRSRQECPLAQRLLTLKDTSYVTIHKVDILKIEFKILAQLFNEYLPSVYPYATENGQQEIKQTDFDEKDRYYSNQWS